MGFCPTACGLPMLQKTSVFERNRLGPRSETSPSLGMSPIKNCYCTLHAWNFVDVTGYVFPHCLFFSCNIMLFLSFRHYRHSRSLLTGLFTQLPTRRSNGNFSPAFNLIDGALAQGHLEKKWETLRAKKGGDHLGWIKLMVHKISSNLVLG